MSKTQALVWGLVLSSVLFAPSCKCGGNLLNGSGEFGGLDNFDERFTAYRGAAGTTVTVCPGQAALLGSLDFSDITYSWEPLSFLDDPSSARPTFTSTQPGNYIYTLTITDSQGRSVTSGVTAIVVPSPSPIIESDRPTVCAGGSLDFTGAGSFAAKGQKITSYAWDFNGDGTTDSSEANPGAQTFPAVGNFPVSLTVTDSLGCSGTDTHTYSICDAPTATFSVVQQKVSESAGTVFINVNLDAPAPADIHIPIAFSGTAVGADYTGPTEIVVPAGTTMGTAQIAITDDVLNESDETIVITLTTGGGAKPGTAATHTITIADNDLLPVIIINDLLVDEGSGAASFTVSLSEPSGRPVSVSFATTETNASCADYTSAAGTLTFAPGETTKQIVIPLIDDALNEDTENFFVTLSAAVNASLLDTHAVGTGEQFGGRTPDSVYGIGSIADNDALPTLSVNNASATERNPPPASSVSANFNVTLSTESGRLVSVSYATFDGTANNGSDYNGDAGLVLLSPATHALVGGVCTQTAPATLSAPLNVPIINNVVPEADEVFTVDLDSPVNAALGSDVGVGTIVDDDPKPMITADSPFGSEASGVVTFTVTLSTVSQEDITVAYTTRDGTAEAGVNYVARSGTLSFPAGTVSQTVSVVTSATDRDRQLFLSLSAPTAARVQPSQCFIATVLDGDAATSLSIQDVTIGEAQGTARVSVVRSGNSASTVGVDYATSGGSAVRDVHYIDAAATLTFNAGEVVKTINVPILDDAAGNPSLVFYVSLSAATGPATISRGLGTVTIIDNDLPTPATLVVFDQVTLEDRGLACVNVIRSGTNVLPTVASFATADGAPGPSGIALAPGDYATTVGTITFDPFEVVKSIGVPIVHDPGSELPEFFTFGLSGPTGGTITPPAARITILDVDGVATLTVSDVTVAENAGIAQVTVNLTGSHPTPVTVSYATANGTAIGAATGPTGDYVPASGLLNFTAFDFQQTITLQIIDNQFFEASELFTFGLTGATGVAGIFTADGSADITIIDDDAAPVFSVVDSSAAESDGTAVFAISLSRQSQVPLSVNYTTADGSALAGATGPTGADYVARSGTANFAPYQTVVNVAVTVNDDLIDEDDEAMRFVLSSPSAPATLGLSGATGTITDNDNPPALSVNSPSVSEGGGTLTFTISLPVPSAKTITVAYTTVDATAIAGFDYTGTTGTATFTPGQTTFNVAVPVTDDMVFELTETLTLSLSLPTNATIAAPSGTGTITENDLSPTIAINDVAFAEADGASKFFTVSLTRAASFPITVDYATANIAAISGPTGDYLASTGTLTFAAGETSKQVIVSIVNDSIDETSEDFAVNLTNASVAPVAIAISDAQGVGTIADDDLPPTLSIANQQGAEGLTGTTGAFAFAVTLSQPSGLTITVDYQTIAGTATAGTDYNTATGTLTFLPGETVKNASVVVRGDSLDEPDETFTVSLASPSNASIAVGTATGTIQNDDTAPTIAIADRLSLPEGATGSTNQTFTVTLNNPSGRTITVDFATANGTATAGSDYTSTTGTVTFPPGNVSQTLNVPIRGDLIDEDVETFTVNLSNASNATISDAIADASIANDDTPPSLSIADVTVTEGSGGGTANATLTVTLSSQSGKPITVSYITSDNTALAASDYVVTGPLILTFNPGVTTQQLVVPVQRDDLNELPEDFFVTLSSPVNASIGDGSATVSITDDDALPLLTIDDVSALEGPSGSTTTFTFTVSLSTASGRNVTFNAQTANGIVPDYIAAAGSDYVAYGPTGGQINAGATSTTIVVTVNGDALDENNEAFAVNLTSVVGATVSKSSGAGEIRNDDTLPVITVNDQNFPEATGASFTVTLTPASGRIVRVSYSTSSGTAISGTDFTGLATTVLTFPAGTTTLPVPVTITSDVFDEDNETFSLNLSAPENATIGDGLGLGTIIDDDALPTLAMGDVTAAEGTLGVGACSGGVTSTPFNFVVTMSPATGSGRPVTVDYATANGPTGVTGALSGSDYTAATGTVTFPVGSTGQVVTVQVGCDAIYEANQQFYLNLTNALTGVSGSVVSIMDNQGLGTITNDDTAPTVFFSQAAQSVGAGNTVNIGVTTSAISELPVTAVFSPTSGTALTPADYSLTTSSPVTVPAGATTATIGLAATAMPTNNRTLVLTMSAPSNATLGAQVTNTTTIQTSLPKVYFTAASQSVNENVVSFTVTVEQAGATADMTSIPFTLSAASTAGTPADFAITTPSPLTIPSCSPGPCQRTITITVVNDNLDEPAETIVLTLGTPTNAELHATFATTHTATIGLDATDLAPSISISPTSVNEPDSGTAAGTLTVSLSQPSGQVVSVQYLSINGPSGATGAVTPADYTAVALNTLTFPVGVTGLTIPITIAGDVVDENNETFDVVLCRGNNIPPGIGCTAGPINASITAPTGTVTITDNDATPSLAIEPVAVSVNEPDTSETVNAIFTVKLTPVSGRPVTVNYATANGPSGVTGAVAPQDYTALGNTLLTFAPGEIQKDITVVVQGDLLNETNETFSFLLSTPVNATITAPTGTGTITDDDPLPSIVVDDAVAVTEGTGAGTTTMDFRVRLTEASGRPVTVQYTTTSLTAALGADFTGPVGTTGTITFPAGVTGITSSVTVTRDSLDELTETMSFNLANATNAQITDANGVGTIIDDDNISVLTIAPTGTTEGAGGTTKQLAFNVTLSPASGRPVSVTVTPATLGGNTATSGTDYLASAGVVTFNPGETVKPFNVTINGDDLDEDNETFTATLSAQSGAALGSPSTAIGTITDDDATPSLVVSDVTLNEGNSGTTPAVFNVSLSSISGRDVRVTYVTANGTATTVDNDYVAIASTVLTITAGQLTGTISVNVNGDTRYEGNDTFVVNLSAAQTGAANDPVTINDTQGQATITNDDTQPELCIDDGSVTEGNAGTAQMSFRVRLTVAGSACSTLTTSGIAASASYATTANTATAATDYTTSSGTVTIAIGATGATFTVPVVGDLLDETDETFAVDLSAPSGAAFGDSSATGTILDDDNPPTVSILGPTGTNEGNAGQTPNLIFTVQLNTPSGKDVTVSYATADGTATTADNDYTAKSGSVIIPAGTISTTISVQIQGDVRYEPDQTFVVNLSSPINAAVGTAQSTGTIINDEALPLLSIANVSLAEGNSGTTNMVFTVSVKNAMGNPAVAGLPITFNYVSANGTALSPGDYTAVNVTGASIPADTSSFTFNVPIAGDTIWENANETFTVTISGAANANTAPGPATATGTINDDDNAPTVSWTFASGGVCEGTSTGPCQSDLGGPYLPGPATVTAALTFSGGTTASGVAITVPFTASSATATSADYSIAPTGSVTIPALSSSANATVTLVDDSFTEGTDTLTLTMGAPSPAAVVTASPSAYDLAIHDNDFNVSVNSATTLDSNQDGQIDLIRVVFSQAVTDSTFPAYGSDGGGSQAIWTLGSGYTNVSLAHGLSAPTGDVSNDNTIYLRFDLKTTPDTAARPALSTTASPGLQSSGVPVSSFSGYVPADGAAPIIITAIGESGDDNLAITFSEPVQSAPSGTCNGTINVSADLQYEDVPTNNPSEGLTATNATDLNGCDNVITVKTTPSALDSGDIFNDRVAPRTNQIYDVAGNAAPNNWVTITGVVHPFVVSAFSNSTTTFQITFSDPVSVVGGTGGLNSALNYANYTLVAQPTSCHAGIALQTGTAIVQDSSTQFTLTTNSQLGCTYLVTMVSDNPMTGPIEGVLSAAANASLINPKSATFTGNEQFRVSSAVSVGLYELEVSFNKPYAPTGPNGALAKDKFQLPTALGEITGVVAATGSTTVRITHTSPQCANVYTVIGANTDTTDGFAETGVAADRPIKSSGTPAPVQSLQLSPRDRAFFAGAGSQLCGPLWYDPFTDQSDFGSLADYGNRVYIGPNKNGNSAARIQYDGSLPEVLTFSINHDTTGAVHSNRGTAGNYTTFGHNGCSKDSSDSILGCGPDNETGRGVFNAITLNNARYLFAGGSRDDTDRNFDYIYATASTNQQLGFSYLDLDATTGPDTRGIESIFAMGNRLYTGYARGPSRRPDLVKTTFVSTDANPCTAGSNCDVVNNSSSNARLFIGSMTRVGRCWDTNCGDGGDGNDKGRFPANPNGAYYAGIDSLFETVGPSGSRLMLANGGHPADDRDGGISRSLSSNVAPCTETLSSLCTASWVDITPTGNQYWRNGVSGTTGTHYSLELVKTQDFIPGDKAFPQWATFGPSGNVFTARNVCRMSSLAGSGVAANLPVNSANIPPNLDFAAATAANHGTMFANCIDGDAGRRAQLWKCTPGADGYCDAGDWSVIDGGGGAQGIVDGYTNFGGASTGNRTLSMVITNGSYLYIGFDNATTGIQIWRTNTANPTNETQWEQIDQSGLTDSAGNRDNLNQHKIYSAISVTDAATGVNYLYLATGKGNYAVSVYRFQNN